MDELTLLRPWALLFFIPLGILGLIGLRLLKRRRYVWPFVDQDLLPLIMEKSSGFRFGPPLLLAIIGSLAILTVAGPSFGYATTQSKSKTLLVIVADFAPDMESGQPATYHRVLSDLHVLAQQWDEGSVALIAYGTYAHLVMPPTNDANVLMATASELKPSLLPQQAGPEALVAALRLADERLSAFDGPGSILVLSNSAPDNLEQQTKENTAAIAYTPASANDFSSQGIRGIDWQPDNSHLTSALA